MKRYPSDILATCVVPWRTGYMLDEGLFRQEIALLRDHLTRRLYLFGTAGEGYAVSDRQFRQLVQIFKSEMSGAADSPMIGLISLSLSTVIERIEVCTGLGIRDFSRMKYLSTDLWRWRSPDPLERPATPKPIW